jgi:flavin reductase (DIM6/NTAB) family NADH-FMN oxidoreductase RutF
MIPASMSRWLQPLPQWSAIALKAPQALVRVKLRTAHGEFDVTDNNVVAALRPLTLAIGIDGELSQALRRPGCCELRFVDAREGGTLGTAGVLGVLQLEHQQDWAVDGRQVALFAVTSGTHRCLQWPARRWQRWLQDRAVRIGTKPGNFALSPAATQQIMIFYICPRPVVLVSVDSGSHSNLFPMDLIGPIAADRFTLALRTSSASVEPMKAVRRVALSDVPASHHKIAYSLGAHHKNAQVDWDSLPFRLNRSESFSLPVPEWALRVRELMIIDVRTVGSHTLFMTQAQSGGVVREGAQFFHTSGIHEHFRRWQGQGLPPATP